MLKISNSIPFSNDMKPRKKYKGDKPGAKPKPAHEKKILVGIYIKQGDVDTLGGKEKVRGIAIDAIEGKLTEE